jgi:hypothetical protein
MILTGVDPDILGDQLMLTNNRFPTALKEIIKRQLSLALSMDNGTALPCLYKSYKGQPIWMNGFFCRYSRQTFHVSDVKFKPQANDRFSVNELSKYIGITVYISGDKMVFEAIKMMQNIIGTDNKKRIVRTAIFQSDSFYRSKRLAQKSTPKKNFKQGDVVFLHIRVTYRKSFGSATETFVILEVIVRDDECVQYRLGNERGVLSSLQQKGDLHLCKTNDALFSSLQSVHSKWVEKKLPKITEPGKLKKSRNKKCDVPLIELINNDTNPLERSWMKNYPRSALNALKQQWMFRKDKIVFSGLKNFLNRSLTTDEEYIMNYFFNDTGNEENAIAAYYGTYTVTHSAIMRLSPTTRRTNNSQRSNWLCDMTVNTFIHMIMKEEKEISMFVVDSLYFGVTAGKRNMIRNSTLDKKPKGIFSFDKLFFIVNESEQHWACVLVDFLKNEIEYLDSLNGRGAAYVDLVIVNLKNEWKNLRQDKTRARSLPAKAKFPNLKRKRDRTLPSQTNGYDCGIFCVYFILYRALTIEVDFSQTDADKLREHLLLALLVQDAKYI